MLLELNKVKEDLKRGGSDATQMEIVSQENPVLPLAKLAKTIQDTQVFLRWV